jgi:hypothetical protein
MSQYWENWQSLILVSLQSFKVIQYLANMNQNWNHRTFGVDANTKSINLFQCWNTRTPGKRSQPQHYAFIYLTVSVQISIVSGALHLVAAEACFGNAGQHRKVQPWSPHYTCQKATDICTKLYSYPVVKKWTTCYGTQWFITVCTQSEPILIQPNPVDIHTLHFFKI